MQKAFIAAGKRTPIGSILGSLKQFSGVELATHSIKATIEDAKIDTNAIDQVILGNVLSTGLGQNPARQASINAGIGIQVPCYNINKVCASGIKAVSLGATDIWSGLSNVIIAGGFESMSNAPHFMRNIRLGHKFGDFGVYDSLTNDGLIDAYSKKAMGYCGEKTAKEMGISRERQDEYCISSYEKCLKAIETGAINREIVPIDVPKIGMFGIDEEPQKFKRDKIPSLKPAFPDQNKNGTITGANASKLNDGACSLLLMSEKALINNSLNPLVQVISFADTEVAPDNFNICPALAAQKALHKAGLQIKDIDFWEINEAFSVTALANIHLLELDRNKVNVHGGAVALGHPIGMSGARIVLSLINVLKTYNGKYGCAVICNGGGGSTALIVKNTV